MKYQFGSDSLLRDVTIIHALNGGKRAYLNAHEHTLPEKLLEIRKRLSEQGYITHKVLHEGEIKLEVRAFQDDQELLRNLCLAGAIANEPQAVMAPEQKRGLWEWIKHNTFKACIAFYFIGDIGITAHGWFQKKRTKNTSVEIREDVYTGLFYFAGTLSSAISTALRGNQSDEEVRVVQEKFYESVKADGVDAEKAMPFAAENKKKQNPIVAFIAKHPAELMNTMFTGAGIFLGLAVMKRLKASKIKEIANPSLLNNTWHKGEKFYDYVDVGTGVVTAASGTLATFVKERPKTSEEKEPESTIGKAWRWLEEKPLRISGIGYMAATGAHLFSSRFKYLKTLHETNSHKEAFFDAGFRSIFGVTNVIAEVLMAHSSKGHGEGVRSDDTVETTAAAMAAEAISTQAPEKKGQLVENYATKLASPKIMGGDKKAIKTKITQHLDFNKKNRWAESVSDAAATPTMATAMI
jgi:hypothetical protein